MPNVTWPRHRRWNTGGQFIRAATKVIVVEKIEKPPCSEETGGQESRSSFDTDFITMKIINIEYNGKYNIQNNIEH